MKTIIHKSLVGSRAHNLHSETSDYDYRAIYVIPTKTILSLNNAYKGSHWVEGQEDNTAYEIGHFLHLATKANPSVLEVITSDHNVETSKYSAALIALAPYMYSPTDAYNAFTGYSLNQRKKFLDDKDSRRLKFAVAYIRTLFNLMDLFLKGSFTLEVSGPGKEILQQIKEGLLSDGDIINLAKHTMDKARKILPDIKDKKDLDAVNDLLLFIRKDFWENE